MSEKRKIDRDKDAIKSPKVVAEINNLIISENIDKSQKSSIFLQMMSYKKQCMALKRRMSELLEEMQIDGDLDENGDNIIPISEDSKTDELHHTAPHEEKDVDNTLFSDTDTKNVADGDSTNVDGGHELSGDGLKTKAKGYVNAKEMIKKCGRELISKDQQIAELEKKLCFYKSKTLEKKEATSSSSDHQIIKNEVEKILSENMISNKLRKENIELRKRLEIAEYEAEQKLFVYTEQNGNLEERHRFLRNKIAALERDNMEYENEVLENRNKYKAIICEQRNEHLRIEERLVPQLRKCKEESRFFRTECTKLGEEADFLAQKLSRTIERYDGLKTQLETVLEVKNRAEADTDQALMEELENLSSAYDKLIREYRNALGRCDDLEEKLSEAERRNLNLLKEVKTQASEAFGDSSANKLPERPTFDDRLFSYEKLRDECEARKKESAYHRNSYTEVSNENDILKQRIECLKRENEEDRKIVDRLNTKLNETMLDYDMMAESQCNLIRIIDRIAGGRSSEILDDVDKYKKLLKCTACDRRYKDSVINKCMHVFCQECLDQRIKSRNRMCPSCGEAFSQNDVKRIYL